MQILIVRDNYTHNMEKKKKKKISLLCEEDNYWLINSSPTFPNYYSTTTTTIMGSSSFYNTTSKEDSKNSFMVFLQKELHLMPININHLHSPFFQASRVRAILWFLKSQRRLNLSIDTVFRASSYFDRFVSINNDNMKWEAAFMELLAVVCLYIAAKFGEVSIPTLYELQMEDLNNSFEVSRIQEMELTVLKALEWRVGCVTSYSYLELLIHQLDSSLRYDYHQCTISSRVTELLLCTLLDSKFTEFRPSTITLAALRCSLEEIFPSKLEAYLSDITSFIPQDQMGEVVNCYNIMEEHVADPNYTLIARGSSYLPSSPVTVMAMEVTDTYNSHVGLYNLIKVSDPISNSKKRKREDNQD